MTLRITSGKYKNKRLQVPDAARPLQERVKLAVFSILGDEICDKNCLDLFAGSGNLGIEAISRGAKKCDFVDSEFFAIKSIKENIDAIGENPEVNTITKSDAVKFTGSTDINYDIIFMDPPYDLPVKHILKTINEILSDNGTLVYFHHKDTNPNLTEINETLKVVDERTYGITTVTFAKKT